MVVPEAETVMSWIDDARIEAGMAQAAKLMRCSLSDELRESVRARLSVYEEARITKPFMLSMTVTRNIIIDRERHLAAEQRRQARERDGAARLAAVLEVRTAALAELPAARLAAAERTGVRARANFEEGMDILLAVIDGADSEALAKRFPHLSVCLRWQRLSRARRRIDEVASENLRAFLRGLRHASSRKGEAPKPGPSGVRSRLTGLEASIYAAIRAPKSP